MGFLVIGKCHATFLSRCADPPPSIFHDDLAEEIRTDPHPVAPRNVAGRIFGFKNERMIRTTDDNHEAVVNQAAFRLQREA